jgi:hypothetical protein
MSVGGKFVDYFGGNKGKDPNKVAQWMKHRPIMYSVVLFLWYTLQTLLGGLLPSWASWTMTAVSFVGMIFLIKVELGHMYGFCDTCFHQPLPSPEDLEKRKPTLQRHHWLLNHPYMPFIAMVCSMAGFLLFSNFLFPGQAWTVVVLFGPMYAGGAWVGHTTQVHSWLRPQCPWCKDNGGGGLVEVVDPVPSGVKQA